MISLSNGFKDPLFGLNLFYLKAQKFRRMIVRLFLRFRYFFVERRFFFHFRQHIYTEWKNKKKHVRLIYIPSAEISSFIKICGLWFVNISCSISPYRLSARVFRVISFPNSSLHTINDVSDGVEPVDRPITDVFAIISGLPGPAGRECGCIRLRNGDIQPPFRRLSPPR